MDGTTLSAEVPMALANAPTNAAPTNLAPPVWSDHVRPCPPLGRKLRVAMPCTGIDGAGEALYQGNVDFEGCNIWDLEGGYKSYLVDHFMKCCGKVPKLHLGRKLGNLLVSKLSDLEGACDLLVSGCPCPPWAGNGCKKSTKDARFQVFWIVIRWILHLITCNGLLAVCLENVQGTMKKIKKEPAFYPRLQNMFENLIPSFVWRIDLVQAMDYLSAATRSRVLLRGMSKLFAPTEVPPVLPPFGARRLADCLGEFPNMPRSSATEAQQQNLQDYDDTIHNMVQSGRISADSLVVVAADRAEKKVFKQTIVVNHAPCLTCHNKYLWVMKANEVKLPLEQRTLYRLIHPSERLTWQGFQANSVDKLGLSLAVKGAGNCFPVGMMMAGLLPLCYAFAEHGGLPPLKKTCKFEDIVTYHQLEVAAKKLIFAAPPARSSKEKAKKVKGKIRASKP